MYLSGASTRDWRRALAPLFGTTAVSRSAVSRVVTRLQGEYQVWQRRALAGGRPRGDVVGDRPSALPGAQAAQPDRVCPALRAGAVVRDFRTITTATSVAAVHAALTVFLRTRALRPSPPPPRGCHLRWTRQSTAPFPVRRIGGHFYAVR
ncbi:MAG: transposase [Gemmatimonadales bacterium]|nr:transposase [Gemmatimonadales bacterium]